MQMLPPPPPPAACGLDDDCGATAEPWLSQLTWEKFRCFRVADDLFLGRIPLDLAANAIGDIAQVPDDAGAVADLDIGDGFASCPHAIDEVLDVKIRCILAGGFAGFHA